MSEPTDTDTPAASESEQPQDSATDWTPPASQAELNRIIAERVNRTKAQFKDYNDLKTKAAQFDEQQERNKSELQRAQEAAQTAQAELQTLRTQSLRTAAARAAGLDADMEQYLTATTEDELTSQAQHLATRLAAAQQPRVPGPNAAQGTSATSAAAVDLSPSAFMNQQLRAATGRGN